MFPESQSQTPGDVQCHICGERIEFQKPCETNDITETDNSKVNTEVNGDIEQNRILPVKIQHEDGILVEEEGLLLKENSNEYSSCKHYICKQCTEDLLLLDPETKQSCYPCPFCAEDHPETNYNTDNHHLTEKETSMINSDLLNEVHAKT